MKEIKILLSSLFFILSVSISVMAAKKTILIIESYHAEYAWDASYKRGIEQEFNNKYNTVYFEMDTKRIPASEYQKRADQAWEKFLQLKPDLVILGDDNALKFLGTRFLETETPVIYLGINNNPRAYLGDGYRKITGVMEKPLLKRAIPVIKQIMGPKLKRVLILFDSGTTSRVSLSHVFNNQSHTSIDSIEVELKFIEKWDDWQQTVLSARENGFEAIIIGLYHTITDSAGKHVDADLVMNWTSRNTPVPPFGFWDFSVGKEMTIGGLVLFGESQGTAAAKIVNQILEEGVSPSDIFPIIGDRGRYLFNRTKLKQYGLSLPESIASRADYTD